MGELFVAWVLPGASGPDRTGTILQRGKQKRAKLFHVRNTPAAAGGTSGVQYLAQLDPRWVQLDQHKDIFGYHSWDGAVTPSRIFPQLSIMVNAER
jgi:hypothetical protein